MGHSRPVTGLLHLNFLEPSGPLHACNGTVFVRIEIPRLNYTQHYIRVLLYTSTIIHKYYYIHTNTIRVLFYTYEYYYIRVLLYTYDYYYVRVLLYI